MERGSSNLKRSPAERSPSRSGELIDDAKKSCFRVSPPSLERHEAVSPDVAAEGRTVWAGLGEVVAAPFKDSGELLAQGDWPALRSRLNEEGYLFLKGALNASDVLKAREYILHALHEEATASFRPNTSPSLALSAEDAESIGLLGRQHIAAAPPVRAVLEGSALFDLMRSLLQEESVATTAFKWLRAVAPEEFTGVHTDRVFLGRGSSRLLTTWIPLGDCPVEQGAMMVVPGSHRRKEFEALRSSYGSSEVGKDGTRSGWLSDNGRCVDEWLCQKDADESPATNQHQRGSSSSSRAPGVSAAIQWRTSDLHSGDVVVLSMDTLHMSAANKSRNIRISCDTRWLPVDEPRDPRLAHWNTVPYLQVAASGRDDDNIDGIGNDDSTSDDDDDDDDDNDDYDDDDDDYDDDDGDDDDDDEA